MSTIEGAVLRHGFELAFCTLGATARSARGANARVATGPCHHEAERRHRGPGQKSARSECVFKA